MGHLKNVLIMKGFL